MTQPGRGGWTDLFIPLRRRRLLVCLPPCFLPCRRHLLVCLPPCNPVCLALLLDPPGKSSPVWLWQILEVQRSLGDLRRLCHQHCHRNRDSSYHRQSFLPPANLNCTAGMWCVVWSAPSSAVCASATLTGTALSLGVVLGLRTIAGKRRVSVELSSSENPGPSACGWYYGHSGASYW